MNATQAREYLRAVVATETGRAVLRALGWGAVIAAPDKGDDAGSIAVAERVRAELARRYGV